jgi:hypothetical protein
MKASDLRVGNWVSKHGEYYQITSATIVSLERGESDAEPIPLTEEWLLKFGFEKRGIYYHFPKHDIFKLEQYKLKNAYWLRYYTESIDCVRINSVHELQNLYHALTGEELTHGK